MNIKIFASLASILMSACLCMPTFSQTPFQKKDKWGLVNDNGKVILKAKYDSIHPFVGDYCIVESKGQKGLVNKSGKEYLPCKFQQILFPIFMNHDGFDYFAASKDGIIYYIQSSKKEVIKPFGLVFYGPDKRWYGFDNEWFDITTPNKLKRTGWDINKSPIEKLRRGYYLFDGKLYSPSNEVKLKNVTAWSRVRISDYNYYKLTTGNNKTFLLNPSKGTILEKIDDTTWSSGKKLWVLKDDMFYQKDFIDNEFRIYTLKHPELNIFSLNTGAKQLLPFKISKYKKIIHKKNDSKLYEFALDSKSGVYMHDLEKLTKYLKQQRIDFIITVKSGMGTSVFDCNGEEIAHNENIQNIYYKDDILMAMIDGGEIIIDPNFDKNLLAYEAINNSHPGNLTNNDFLVMKNGMWGLYETDKGETVPPLYDGINRLANHIYVSKNGLLGLYTKHGVKIADPIYKWIEVGNYYDNGPQYYVAKKPSGDTYMIGDHGQILGSLGNIDRVELTFADESGWAPVYKNKKFGVLDIKNHRITVPCIYEDNYFLGVKRGLSTKIGVYRETTSGTQVDIWTLGGSKIASQFFPSGTSRYAMKRFLENHLQVSLYFS